MALPLLPESLAVDKLVPGTFVPLLLPLDSVGPDLVKLLLLFDLLHGSKGTLLEAPPKSALCCTATGSDLEAPLLLGLEGAGLAVISPRFNFPQSEAEALLELPPEGALCCTATPSDLEVPVPLGLEGAGLALISPRFNFPQSEAEAAKGEVACPR